MAEDKSSGITKYDWGYALEWATHSQFNGKILVFEKADNKTLLHFHREKERVWFVNTGRFNIRWVNTANAEVLQAELKEGYTYRAKPLQPVQLIALEDKASITEVSNTTGDEDIFYLSE
jgi:uncharacterized RmlC-like cupin family protein